MWLFYKLSQSPLLQLKSRNKHQSYQYITSNNKVLFFNFSCERVLSEGACKFAKFRKTIRCTSIHDFQFRKIYIYIELPFFHAHYTVITWKIPLSQPPEEFRRHVFVVWINVSHNRLINIRCHPCTIACFDQGSQPGLKIWDIKVNHMPLRNFQMEG